MNVETLNKLYAYNRWANEQVWECVATLPEVDYMAEHDYSTGSVFEQVFHMMQYDWWLIHLLNNDVPPYDDLAWPQQDDYKDRDTLWKKWQEINTDIMIYLDKVTDVDLQKSVQFPVPEGYDAMFCPTWELHMIGINHGTNHRAQVLALLHKRGGKTEEQGYFYHILARETAAKSTT